MRNITDVVGDLRKGAALADLNDEYQKVVKAVRETGKSGTVTLKLTIKPNGETVFVDDDISSKPPKPAKNTSMFYADEDGGLHRRDPRQGEMTLSAVAPGGGTGTVTGEAAHG